MSHPVLHSRASSALEVVVCIVNTMQGRHIAVVAEAEVKGQMALKYPAVICQTALRLCSLLISGEQLSLSSNGSISDEFGCVLVPGF